MATRTNWICVTLDEGTNGGEGPSSSNSVQMYNNLLAFRCRTSSNGDITRVCRPMISFFFLFRSFFHFAFALFVVCLVFSATVLCRPIEPCSSYAPNKRASILLWVEQNSFFFALLIWSSIRRVLHHVIPFAYTYIYVWYCSGCPCPYDMRIYFNIIRDTRMFCFFMRIYWLYCCGICARAARTATWGPCVARTTQYTHNTRRARTRYNDSATKSLFVQMCVMISLLKAGVLYFFFVFFLFVMYACHMR